jgi:hypothetical protein
MSHYALMLNTEYCVDFFMNLRMQVHQDGDADSNLRNVTF